MKSHSLLLTKSAVGLTILFGVLLILFANQQSFQKIVVDDTENISKLSASIIYSEIDNSLTKPIFVALTMANDLFLRNWLEQENPNSQNLAQTQTMQQYLANYCQKYQYDSAFVVSEKSALYYHPQGINKEISPQNAHDVWYYDFIKSGKAYDLDVDFDEAHNNELTVFVNCKITDAQNKLLGVVGVGIQMSHLQELLKKYESEYNLRAFLINDQGLVQVDSILKNIEQENFFDDPEKNALREKIVSHQEGMNIFWYPEGGFAHCLITQYVENMDWYIVIEKDTSHTQQILMSQINRDLLPIAVIILLVLLLISYMIAGYNRMLLKTASIDDVTGLPNVKMFQEIFKRNSQRPACREGFLFLFDIDHFKNINDHFGHLSGNTVLYRISEVSKEIIGTHGLIARWGGDEFVGVVYCPCEQATQLFEQIVQTIASLDELGKVTISLGATRIDSNCDLDSMIEHADHAMYRSKDQGGNQVALY